MSRFFDEFGDDDDDDLDDDYPTQKLVKGIDLTDLFSGKDVLFQINQQYDDYLSKDYNVEENDDEDESEESTNVIKPKTIAEMRNRGAPFPNISFKELSEAMTSIDPNGYVKKEILTQGTGSEPPECSRVIVHYNFYKEYDPEPFDSTYLRDKPARLYLNAGEIIPGLELAIKTMKKNENSRFIIKYQAAFGELGCPPRIEPKCDILADVTLLNFVDFNKHESENEVTINDMKNIQFQQAMKEAKSYHCSGNEEFCSGRPKGAIKCYRKCVNILNGMKLANQTEEEQMLALKVKCLVNLAVAYNKIGRYEQTCVASREALSVDPSNVKAMFQYGKANMCLSNFNIAQKWLMKALKLKPEDKDIKETIKKLDQRMKSTKLEDMLFCQRAFTKLSCDSPEQQEQKKSEDSQ